MLRSLSIRDFVIVDALDLEFASGFTVLSGETGAGKSILLDALALTLGGRADAGVVREGCARADLTAEFELTGSAADEARAWLAAQEVQADDNLLMLRRTVDASGRSKGFINGIAATQAQLRELGDMLVDIHGQHAHQLLLKPGAQRAMLDRHAGLGAHVHEVSQRHRLLAEIRRRIEAADTRSREMQLERERVEWQLGEMEKLAPQPGEWEQIQGEHGRLAHAVSLIEGTQGALDVISENEMAVLPQLAGVIQALQRLSAIDPDLKDALEALEPAQLQLEEAAHTLSRYAQRLEVDPERLAEVESRMQALHGAARKYRLDPEQLPAELEQRRAQLAALERAQDLDALRAEENTALAAYESAAKVLSKARKSAATKLSREVTAAMQALSMAGGRFDIALMPLDEGGAHGLEAIEFLVAGHAGVQPKPLARVASGGELARISLAISVITSTSSLTPTLIFDEVDSGIGGAVAEVVGTLLRQLGDQQQVLCVTHLPQVAAQGHMHLRVAKAVVKGRTLSRIEALDGDGRIEEVARMLGGADITETTREHAREMLGRAGTAEVH